jgi:HPt (histidine-containing phosphotransfer) domain-containing protein
MTYPIQIDELLERVSGNREFVVRMLDLFFQTSDDRIRVLRIEFNRRNFEELAEQSHKLKGLIGNLSITGALPILKDIHTLARQKNESGIEKLLDELDAVISEAALFFRQHPHLDGQ